MPQLLPGDEIIVVDNNSTDNTAAIAHNLKVKIIQTSQQGISFARNTGFNKAQNPLLARTDADTIVGTEWLRTIRLHFTDSKSTVAITGPVYFKFGPVKFGAHQGLAKRRLGHETLVGSNLALTKHHWDIVHKHLSNNDRDYAEDVEMAGIIYKLGGSIKFASTMSVQTSARWILQHPLHSLLTWRRKQCNTRHLLEKLTIV